MNSFKKSGTISRFLLQVLAIKSTMFLVGDKKKDKEMIYPGWFP